MSAALAERTVAALDPGVRSAPHSYFSFRPVAGPQVLRRYGSMTASEVPDLHDFTLERVVVDWAQKVASIELRGPGGPRSIALRGLREIVLPRHEPWGPSASVNKAAVARKKGDVDLRLTIEMQSGDVIEALCAEVR